jgi:hypothetical protein
MLIHSLRDRCESRDWKRPWRDPPGFFFPECLCCGSVVPSHHYTTYGGTKAGGIGLQDTQQYSIDAWTTKTDMPSNTRYSACAEFVGSAAYITTGTSDSSPYWLTSTISYTPDTWTTKASITASRQNATSFPLDSAAFVVGGYDGAGSAEASSVYKYDPTANSWSTKTSITQTQYDMFGFASASYGYAVGGFHVSSYLNTNYQYDPSGNSWATKTAMTTTRSTGSRGMFLSGLGYCAGGINTGGIIATNEAYDETTNSWATKSSMTTGRVHMGSGETDGSTGYTTGGQSLANTRTQTHEEFTPNAWTNRTNVPVVRSTNFSARA